MAETKVVILNGPPGCGKDVTASYLADYHKYAHREFKRKLIEVTCCLFSLTVDHFMSLYTRELKEQPSPKLNGMSPRESLIFVSEVVIKPNFGKMYFGEAANKELVFGAVNVFSDGGFFEEAELISKARGRENLLILRLHREGCDFSKDSRRYLTDEECSVLASRYVDVYNDSSELDFFKKIQSEIQKWATS